EEMADKRRAAREHGIILREKIVGEQHDERTLTAIEKERREREALAARPKHVGRTDIARANFPHIAKPGHFGEQQPERDGTDEIADDCRREKRPGEAEIAKRFRHRARPCSSLKYRLAADEGAHDPALQQMAVKGGVFRFGE